MQPTSAAADDVFIIRILALHVYGYFISRFERIIGQTCENQRKEKRRNIYLCHDSM